MKTCNVCGEAKPITDFYKASTCKDGYRSTCKKCHLAKGKAYVSTEVGRKKARESYKKWKKDNPEKLKESQRKHYYEGGGREYQRQYNQTPEAKESNRLAIRKYKNSEKHKNRDRAKILAVYAVNNAVERGDLPHIPTLVCNRCGNQAEHYHHWSYEREHWLDVIPLCRICHAGIHAPTPCFVE